MCAPAAKRTLKTLGATLEDVRGACRSPISTHHHREQMPYPHHRPDPNESAQPPHAHPPPQTRQSHPPSLPPRPEQRTAASRTDHPNILHPGNAQHHRAQNPLAVVSPRQHHRHPPPYRPAQSQQRSDLGRRPRRRAGGGREFVVTEVRALDPREGFAEDAAADVVDDGRPCPVEGAAGEEEGWEEGGGAYDERRGGAGGREKVARDRSIVVVDGIGVLGRRWCCVPVMIGGGGEGVQRNRERHSPTVRRLVPFPVRLFHPASNFAPYAFAVPAACRAADRLHVEFDSSGGGAAEDPKGHGERRGGVTGGGGITAWWRMPGGARM